MGGQAASKFNPNRLLTPFHARLEIFNPVGWRPVRLRWRKRRGLPDRPALLSMLGPCRAMPTQIRPPKPPPKAAALYRQRGLLLRDVDGLGREARSFEQQLCVTAEVRVLFCCARCCSCVSGC